MKTTLITSLFITSLFCSCTSDVEENIDNKTKAQTETTDSTSIEAGKVVLPVEVKIEKTVEERTISFFNWYELNATNWHKNTSAIVGLDDEYYFIDTTNLNSYISWLNASTYFSDSYIISEDQQWREGCNSVIEEWKKEGYETDGIPPCVYEADIIFRSQDVDIKQEVANLTITTDTISETYAVIDYGESKLYWIKEAGTWKISGIHSPSK